MMNYFAYGNSFGGAMTSAAIFGILGIILAVAATVLAFIFIIPEKKYATLPKFFRIVADIFNFKNLMIETILRALYIFFTCYAIISGFFTLFSSFLGGLIVMVLAPIGIRFVFELLMMAILAVKNIISINQKLKNQNEQ